MRLLLGLAEPTGAAPASTATSTTSSPTRCRRSGRCSTRVPPEPHGAQPPPHPRHAGRLPTRSQRIEELLDLVDLHGAADRTVGGYSLGMRQRLALASASSASPAAFVLDEPFNGLDPDGIRTMRQLLRNYADRGGTVFLSSHLLAEVAHSADELIVIQWSPRHRRPGRRDHRRRRR